MIHSFLHMGTSSNNQTNSLLTFGWVSCVLWMSIWSRYEPCRPNPSLYIRTVSVRMYRIYVFVVSLMVFVGSSTNHELFVSISRVVLCSIAKGGPPLGYFDWNMIEQAAWGGVESAVLFGAASLAMELAFNQKWISKFD